MNDTGISPKINKLERIEDFKSILKNYKPKNLDYLKDTRLVFMVGPTAAGRNTLINILVDTGRYHYVLSDTTRMPRVNNSTLEKDGVEYWFKTEDQVLEGLQSGEYLEAAIIHNQQVSGISLSELERAGQSGKIAIDEIEVVGAKNIYSYKDDALFVFLLPPAFDVWMERLRSRGQLEEAEVRRRLESALDEINKALEADFYTFVINNEIHEAAVAVDELANGRNPNDEKQQQGRDHAEQLVIDVRLYLESSPA